MCCQIAGINCVSAMDASVVGKVGHPFGECVVIWHSNLMVPLAPVITHSKHICAVMARSHQYKILFVSVYMPNDNNTDENYNTFGDVLHELSAMIALRDDCHIIIGGDFNVDFSRQSRNLTLLRRFLMDDSVACRNHIHNIVFV